MNSNHPNGRVAHAITDAVTQTNVEVVAQAPAVGEANLMMATSNALSGSAHNATSAQQNANMVVQASTTQGVSLIFGVDTSTTAVGIAKILNIP